MVFNQLEAHLETCALQTVSCRYACTGCSVKLPRGAMNTHENDAGAHMRGLLDCFVAERAAAHATINALQQQLANAHASIAELKGAVYSSILFTIPFRAQGPRWSHGPHGSQGQFGDYTSAPFSVHGYEFTLTVNGQMATIHQSGSHWRGSVSFELLRRNAQSNEGLVAQASIDLGLL